MRPITFSADEYNNGLNWRAITALAAGIAVPLLGLIVPPLRFLYD
jgi:NCS1 family nucleobase:cation symporter-1